MQKVTVTKILAKGVILVQTSFLSSNVQVLVGNLVLWLSQADHRLQSDSYKVGSLFYFLLHFLFVDFSRMLTVVPALIRFTFL